MLRYDFRRDYSSGTGQRDAWVVYPTKCTRRSSVSSVDFLNLRQKRPRVGPNTKERLGTRLITTVADNQSQQLC